jgi:uncharacterized membrane protein
LTLSMTPGEAGARWPLIDAGRGAAILAMIVYHAVWDLGYFRFTSIDAEGDPAWRWFAHIIAGTFLALVGVGLVLATRNGFRPRRYFRRLAIIVAAALLVTIGTYLVFPEAFVFFGILHFIAAASVLGLPFVRLPVLLTAIAAAACLAAPAFVSHPFFNEPGWWWLGLSTVRPATVDYVPLLPWFGVTLGGIAAARLLLAWRGETPWSTWRPRGLTGQGLVRAGRWSLPIYLVHQPILFGLAYLASTTLTPSAAMTVEEYLDRCTSACVLDGGNELACETQCECDVRAMERAKILEHYLAGRLPDAEAERLPLIIGACRLTPPG